MIKINLLPYRDARRQKVMQGILIFWFLMAAAGAGAAYGVDYTINQEIDAKKQIRKKNDHQIDKLNEKLGEIKDIKAKKEAVQALLDTIERLQQARFLQVHVLDELSRAIPPKVWLMRLTTREQLLELTGKAQSNAMVADFMNNLNASPYFSQVKLSKILSDTEGEHKVKRFILKAEITPPAAAKDADAKDEEK
ncbi:MAG: PilN domain-containing protein [Magnetococcales bacterium]|nr:PilN domain-containing protein [Magnetococcales bacterium]